MLWKTKRIEHGLRRMWGKTATWDRTLPHIVRDIREFRHQINIICAEMQHFISQVTISLWLLLVQWYVYVMTKVTGYSRSSSYFL